MRDGSTCRTLLVALIGSLVLVITGCTGVRDQTQMPDRTDSESVSVPSVVADGDGSLSGRTSSSGPPPGTAPESLESDGPIRVLVTMPDRGHTGPVEGWVSDLSGQKLAEFELPATWLFLEEPSGDNRFQPSTSLTGAPTEISVELPTAGVYVFEIGEVAFWGGCGTCGRGHAGGRVEILVKDGTVVSLDLGQMTWRS